MKPFVRYGTDAGLRDTSTFVRCLADTTTAPLIKAGLTAGKELDVRGTPTVFVNG
jgi:protein-disulfide isomerase